MNTSQSTNDFISSSVRSRCSTPESIHSLPTELSPRRAVKNDMELRNKRQRRTVNGDSRVSRIVHHHKKFGDKKKGKLGIFKILTLKKSKKSDLF